MVFYTSPPERRSFIDRFAWLPIKAYDEYSGRSAWVWLRVVRVHDDGTVTFSSFWI